jgi:hypothetical protein
MERLRAAGAEVFRTDEDGSVTVDLGPGPLRVHASGTRTAALPTRPGTADRVSWPDPPIRLGYDAQRDGPHSGRTALPPATCEPLPPSRHLVRRRRADRSRARLR